MRRHPLAVVALLFLLLGSLALDESAAQPQPATGSLPQPRLLSVLPTGGKAGDTTEVALSGIDMDDPQGLVFSHPGIKAEFIDIGKPDAKKTATARFKVTIPADTPIGTHDIRIYNRWGASNPRAFVVGDLPETLEKEPNNDVEQAQRIELNSAVSGTIGAPTDVDYYGFTGKKGQRVVVSCLASSIDSRLHAAVQLYAVKDSAFLAFNRDYRGHDALLDAVLPEDGDYYVRVFAFTYSQGTAEHFYRLTVSTAPWIDAVYPPVVEPGKAAKLTVYGRNLPEGKADASAVVDGRTLEKMTVTLNVPNDPQALARLAFRGPIAPQASALDGFEYRVRNAAGASNPFLLTYAHAPVVLDNEANDTADTAQEIALPCEIAGRIEKKRDRDWYRFTAKKGDVYGVEAFGERLGSPLNLVFSVRDAGSGKVLYESTDVTETLSPVQFVTRTDDPLRYRWVVPADGKYHLMVTSREAFLQGGPRHIYRVRMAPERPDFRLVVMPLSANSPDACVVRQGGHQAYTVFVWRQDGFNGDITIQAEGLPDGVTCPSQTIAAGARQAVLVVAAATDAPDWTGSIRVTGAATLDGEKVVREARPASITWLQPPQLNTPAVCRLDYSLALAVREQAPFALTIMAEKMEIKAGEKLPLTVKLDRHWADFKGNVQVTALSLPPNTNLAGGPITLAPGKDETKVTLDTKPNTLPGTYTVVLRGQASIPFARDPSAKTKANVTMTQPSGAITVTVLAK
ncbi:MAG: PPC domain-containing protein [Gemmataceae bacterium]|nr:PPC domain-containing protein [Gemmataceae bacterium]